MELDAGQIGTQELSKGRYQQALLLRLTGVRGETAQGPISGVESNITRQLISTWGISTGLVEWCDLGADKDGQI